MILINTNLSDLKYNPLYGDLKTCLDLLSGCLDRCVAATCRESRRKSRSSGSLGAVLLLHQLEQGSLLLGSTEGLVRDANAAREYFGVPQVRFNDVFNCCLSIHGEALVHSSALVPADNLRKCVICKFGCSEVDFLAFSHGQTQGVVRLELFPLVICGLSDAKALLTGRESGGIWEQPVLSLVRILIGSEK